MRLHVKDYETTYCRTASFSNATCSFKSPSAKELGLFVTNKYCGELAMSLNV